MAKFIPDVKTQRWVVIAPGRIKRPDILGVAKQQAYPVCPLCPGNEMMTPLEVLRIGEGEANKSGWKVRVVPNKWPITDIHEVIIHSPDDVLDVDRLEIQQVELVIKAYRQRFLAHQENGQVLIFCNHGESAGASLRHPHSQLVVVPNQITLDTLVREPFKNIIDENTFFITYCPDFSQWPYEVWIAPKNPGSMFGEIKDNEISDLAKILQKILIRLRDKYLEGSTPKVAKEEDFTYNYYIYHGKDWYFRIIPRFVHRAGFELGTGLQVNVKDPLEAARELA